MTQHVLNLRLLSPHPALQLRGELGLKPAGGSFAVVSLDEDFISQRCTVPQLLQIVELGRTWTDIVRFDTVGL